MLKSRLFTLATSDPALPGIVCGTPDQGRASSSQNLKIGSDLSAATTEIRSAKMKKAVALFCLTGSFLGFGAGVKISERFGFDSQDSTRFLQAALDSYEKEIILDRRESPWIVRPLLCTNGNKTIRIEAGVKLVAKRGEFHGKADSLMVFRRCKNVRFIGAGADKCFLEMWRSDYADTNLFTHSEHRMGISLFSCEDMLIEGVTVRETGGDGLYIAGLNSVPCRNVTVRDCVFDRNYRQGISVISVDGLLIENVVMSNTKGAKPQCGIDFEPNTPKEMLSRIVMRNCLATNNAASGYAIVPNFFNSESAKVDITFENCRAIDNAHSAWGYLGSFRRRTGYDAEIPYRELDVLLKNCEMARNGKRALSIHTRPLSSGKFMLENCLIEDCGLNDPDAADIAVTVTGHEGYEPLEIEFKGVAIRQSKPRKWIDFGNKPKPYKGEPTRISGDATVEVNSTKTKYVLDEAWRSKNTPFIACGKKAKVARVKVDLGSVEIVDEKAGESVDATAVFVRPLNKRKFYNLYTLYAKKDEIVAIDFLAYSHSNNKGVLKVGKYGDAESFVCKKTIKRDQFEFKFTAPETGFYGIKLHADGMAIAATSFNVPLAIDVSDGRGYVLGMKKPVEGFDFGRLYVNVPKDTKAFTAAYFGDGREALKARFLDPQGAVAYEFEPVAGLRYAHIDNPESGLWTLQLDQPARHKVENHSLSLNGIPSWYFLSDKKYWR